MGSHARKVVAFLVAVPVVACAGSGIWTSTGPYGGLTYDLVIDPATPSNLYATSRGGVFRSSDGGTSWQRAQSGIIGSVSWDYPLMMDGDRPQRLYSMDTAGRLYRSTDGALNWSPTGYVLPATESAWRLADKPGAGTEGVYFLATQSGGSLMAAPGLLRTVDDGATMVRLGGGLPNTGFIAIAADPADGNRVLAGTDYRFDLAPTDPSIPSLWRSTDGGDTWTPVYTEAGTGISQRVDSIAWGAGSRVYALVDCSLLRSDNDGASWTFASFNCFSAMAAHPSTADTVYAGGSSGLQVSTDGGVTFAPSPTTLTPNPTYTDTLGRPIPAYVRRIVLDPTFPAAGAPIWAVTEGGGLFRSLDGAATFSNFGVNDGLAAANVRALAVHPSALYTATGASPNRPIYAGFGDSFYGSPALWRSVNNGATWPTSNTNLKGSNIRAIAFDPTTVGGAGQVNNAPSLATGIVYAVGRSAINGVNAQYRNSGVYKSTNGGGTWTMLDGGMPRSGTAPNDFANIGTLRGVLVDPRSCANPPPGNARCGTDPLVTTGQSPANTIWAAGNGRGALGWRVMRSTDGGANWASRDNGIPVPSVDGQVLTPIILAMDPNDSNTLYLSTTINFDYLADPVPTIANGVFKTTDGGANWVPANGPAVGGLPRYPGSTDTALDVLAMAVHPIDSGKLWASTIRFNTPLGFADTGLYRSADGGNTWVSSSSRHPGRHRHPRAHRRPHAIRWCSTPPAPAPRPTPGAVYKSDNGGDTWRSISVGLPADSALALGAGSGGRAPDPRRHQSRHLGPHPGAR